MGKKKKRKMASRSTQDAAAEGGGAKKPRHPPHLRGKQIGLYYANLHRQGGGGRKKEKKKAQELAPLLATVYLTDAKKRHIRRLLEDNQLRDFFVVDDGSYGHVRDSKFKRAFLQIISGSIQDRLVEGSSLANDEPLNRRLYEELGEKRRGDAKYQHMQQTRRRLPAHGTANEILQLLDRHQVVVISGETGCGKTTQVSQFILDDYIDAGRGSLCRIICTQPRRISAISVAERVAEERGEALGVSSGYQIRLEKKLPRSRGSVCFCTTGVVLKQMEKDPCLSEVSHIILDEIHERDIMSDFLICLLKRVIAVRKDLRVILMSATLNAEQFSRYYGDCPMVNIPGFTFPVEEYYLEDVVERTGFTFRSARRVKKREAREFEALVEPYVRKLQREGGYSVSTLNELRKPESEELSIDLVYALLLDICRKETDRGAILVFLTGISEISALYTMLENSRDFPKHRYLVIPLHSQLSTVDQRKVFDRPPSGVRKIVLSTNIAETSITIDDVVFVINSGRIKVKNYRVEDNVQTLLSEWVSLANASQRRGRAGRVQAGYCYHLYTRRRHMLLEAYQKPEILRTRLEEVILTIKVLQLGKAEPFLERLLDSPDPQTVTLSLNLLKRLNALTEDENLTPLGYHLAKLPMNPQIGKMILLGAIFSCLDPVLSIATSLDFKDPFIIPLNKESQADAKKLELSNGWKSDHLLLHEALNGFDMCKRSRQFCHEYFLSWYTLNQLINMKKQFMNYLYDLNFVPDTNPYATACNCNSHNMSLVKAIVCAGLYPNVVTVSKKKKHPMLKLLTGERVEIHPKSILSKCKNFDSELLVFYTQIRSTKNYIHDATMVHPLSLLFFGDQLSTGGDAIQQTISVTNGLRFRCGEETSMLVMELRDRMNWFLEYKISHPGVVDWNKEEDGETKVLRAIMELITSEDRGDDELLAVDDDDDDDEDDDVVFAGERRFR